LPFRAGSIALQDGPASPYGAPITVSGLTGPLTSVAIVLQGLTHPNPADLDVLLVSPDGRTMVVQSDAGGGGAANNVVYALADGFDLVPNLIVAGAYGPTSRAPADSFPAPAPAPAGEGAPAGTATLDDTFLGIDPNGVWRLYIVDDTAGGTGDLADATLPLGVPVAGADYVDTNGPVVFPPGVTTRTVTLRVIGDTAIEPDETFNVDLFSPTNGVIGDGRGVVTIRNDDGGRTPPTARDDAYAATKNTRLDVPVTGGVLTNDTFSRPGFAVRTGNPANGSLTLYNDGSFVYTPNAGFVGTDTFRYVVDDENGTSNVATVTIHVYPPTSVLPPTNVRVHSIQGNRVTVLQDPPAGGPTPDRFELAGGILQGQELAVLDAGVEPVFSFDGPPGSFHIRKHSRLGAERSGPSNEVPLKNNTTETPSAPGKLLGLVNGSALRLTWEHTFGGGIATNTILNVSGAATLSLPLGPAEAFSYPSVPPGEYTFRVTAANAGGSSPASNAITLTFPGPCSGPPEMPTDFFFFRTGNRVDAIWASAPTGSAPEQYLLDVESSYFTGRVPVSQRSIGANVPPGDYSARVAARNACGDSPWTAWQTVPVP
jgi:hypothetical protein